MNSKKITSRFLVLTGMILAAAFVRLLPHPPNFAPITAMALFGGAYFTKKQLAFVVPLAAMFITDMIIGFHSTMWAVYLSFALIVVLGMTMIKTIKFTNVLLATVTASVLFFVITNFAVWAAGIIYPQTFLGLTECYTAAIPFFQYSLIGNLLFTGVMFGVFEIVKAKFPVLAEVKA